MMISNAEVVREANLRDILHMFRAIVTGRLFINLGPIFQNAGLRITQRISAINSFVTHFEVGRWVLPSLSLLVSSAANARPRLLVKLLTSAFPPTGRKTSFVRSKSNSGILAGTVGTLGSFVLTWVLTRQVFEIAWFASPLTSALGLLATTLIVGIVGVISSLDVLRKKPLTTLRAE